MDVEDRYELVMGAKFAEIIYFFNAIQNEQAPINIDKVFQTIGTIEKFKDYELAYLRYKRLFNIKLEPEIMSPKSINQYFDGKIHSIKELSTDEFSEEFIGILNKTREHLSKLRKNL